MKDTHISFPELALVAGTRAALGAGVGLLLAGCLSDEQRRAVGWTLLTVGAVSTVPLAFEVLSHARGTNGTKASAFAPASAPALSDSPL